MSSVLKIFSYLPNPRVWKALIAGKVSGVEVQVIGDKHSELGKWLWVTSPRELEEEANIKRTDYTLIKNLSPIIEDYIGINNRHYRNIYYLGICNNNVSVFLIVLS